MISPEEMERSDHELAQLKLRIMILTQEKLNGWARLFRELDEEAEDIENDLHRIKNQLKHYTIKSPVNGTIEEVHVVDNLFINKGEIVALISPDTSLVAEIYVDPNQIPLIKIDGTVQLRIQSYDHDQWAMIKGTVSSIADDAKLLNGKLQYRVLCYLNPEQLSTSNKLYDPIKKGMPVLAFFPIGKRTLFQILFYNIENWIIPSDGKLPVHV